MIVFALSCICTDMGQFALQMTNAAGQGGDISPNAIAPVARLRWPEAFDQGPTQADHAACPETGRKRSPVKTLINVINACPLVGLLGVLWRSRAGWTVRLVCASGLAVFSGEVPEYEVRNGQMFITFESGARLVMPLHVFMQAVARAQTAIAEWRAQQRDCEIIPVAFNSKFERVYPADKIA
jgi:hypothetical protein